MIGERRSWIALASVDGVGPVTFGRLYDTFPFDNRLVRLTLSVEALERGIANTLRRGRRGAFGISGVRVQEIGRAHV